MAGGAIRRVRMIIHVIVHDIPGREKLKHVLPG
jgi:hypothetical protein